MIRVNIHEAKAQLSSLIEKVAAGETVIVCRRNAPVAEIRALPERPRTRRRIGPPVPGFEVPAAFFEPLPPDLLEGFGARGA